MHSCRCCLRAPPDKDLTTPYTHLGETEAYSDMLVECFNIHLELEGGAGGVGICAACAGRLRDARDFKLQVQRSQAELRARAQGAPWDEDVVLAVKTEADGQAAWDDADVDVSYGEPVVKPELEEDVGDSTDENIFYEGPLAKWEVDERTEELSEAESTSSMVAALASHTSLATSHRESRRASRMKETHDNTAAEEAYTCDTCGKHFTGKASLIEHVHTHAAPTHAHTDTHENPYSCAICNKRFSSSGSLRVHKEMHFGIKPYHCKMCNKDFAYKYVYDLHKRNHDRRKPYRCEICNKYFSHESALSEHKEVHAASLSKKPVTRVQSIKEVAPKNQLEGVCTYSCRRCSKQFSSRDLYTKHIKDHASDICKEQLAEGPAKIIKGRKHYACKDCDKTFVIAHLRRHLPVHMKGILFDCEVCNKQLSSLQGLSQHKKRHTEDKLFVCDECGMRYLLYSGLKQHIRSHTGEKPFECKICNKRYATEDSLKRHNIIHTGEKAYTCNECNKEFVEKSGLKRHKIVHTGEKPYACEICNKRFGFKKTVEAHKVVHTGERPHCCDVCNKAFAHLNNLRRHELIHAGGKPYICGECNKQFTTKHNLAMHVRIHTGEKPFSCDVCNKRFTQKGSLDGHKRVHRQEKRKGLK